ncbi:MAG TPA: hypothetical protein VIF44_00965 [Candidatus Limnocylindrales bacterium]
MSLARRSAAALEAAVSDPGAWPIGILGFLVRGGVVVLALPILTLPSPVGVGTILGPAVVSTGRIEGPLRDLLIVATTAFAVIVAIAVLLAAVDQSLLHQRWGIPPAAVGRAAVGRLAAGEILALLPLGAAIAVTLGRVVDDVHSELLLPGDLSVSFAARVVARSAVPLGVLVGALLVTEALDGMLSRRVLVRDRRPPAGLHALASVVGTAAVGWLMTLVVLVPGLAIIGATWDAARVAWSRSSSAVIGSADAVLAMVATVALVAVWVGILLLCGMASLVRAHLWTSRVSVEGDWTSVGH